MLSAILLISTAHQLYGKNFTEGFRAFGWFGSNPFTQGNPVIILFFSNFKFHRKLLYQTWVGIPKQVDPLDKE